MTALYIHFPFCLQKCRYCGFLSFPWPQGQIEAYLQLVQQEIALYSPHTFDSVYLGGGTPSLTPTNELIRLMEHLQTIHSFANAAEITLEMNPATFRIGFLDTLKSIGINRLSLGAQSFQANELQILGRQHSVQDIFDVFKQARKANFDNISLDLMFGLPGQTLAGWQKNLQNAISLQPEHISFYALSIEKNSAFYYLQNSYTFPDDEQVAQFYETGREMLAQAGYQQYEIANFCLPGKRSRHNLHYWQRQPYLGIGLGAHGMPQADQRTANLSSLSCYRKAINNQQLPYHKVDILTQQQQLSEILFLGLRLVEGIHYSRIETQFQVDLEQAFPVITRFLNLGILQKEDDYLRLAPQFFFVSNSVFVGFV